MGNIVYTTEKIRAILEETRLNAEPDSNRHLYDSMWDAKDILRTPLSERVDSMIIDDTKKVLAIHTSSYVARHYRQQLQAYRLMQEADELLQAKTVFDMNEMAYLIRDLGNYSGAENQTAQAYRQELDKLWVQVQKGKLHAQGIQPLKVSEIKIIAENLRPYQGRSAEISGIHTRLDKEVRDLEGLVS